MADERAQRHPARWRLAVGTVWLLLPLGLLIALPSVLRVLIGRRFTWCQVALAMPDVTVFLAVAAVAGAVLILARLLAASGAAPRPERPRRPA